MVEATQKGPVVMFIDDIHNLCPPPPASNNGAAILKPALGRGLLRCIGASSVDKFKKSIEQDAALERRFQQIHVAELDEGRPYPSCVVCVHAMKPITPLKSMNQRRRGCKTVSAIRSRALPSRQSNRPTR